MCPWTSWFAMPDNRLISEFQAEIFAAKMNEVADAMNAMMQQICFASEQVVYAFQKVAPADIMKLLEHVEEEIHMKRPTRFDRILGEDSHAV